MTTPTWRDLNFRDTVTLPDGIRAEVVGVRRCAVHPAGDAQLRLATDTDENDPLWYPAATLTRGTSPKFAKGDHVRIVKVPPNWAMHLGTVAPITKVHEAENYPTEYLVGGNLWLRGNEIEAAEAVRDA